jgi:hypothetical protein
MEYTPLFLAVMKNLHDFFNFPTGVVGFSQMLGRFRVVIAFLKTIKMLESTYQFGIDISCRIQNILAI